MRERLSVITLICGGVVLVVVGCSSGPPMFDKTEVADEISYQLEQKAGRAPESVSCPQDLRGEVGATQRCELKNGPETYGITVTVTKVEGPNIDFDVKVDDQPS